MSTFKDRLLEEKAQLDERSEKLGSFIEGPIFSTIEPIQQSLLKVQLAAMFAYSKCLAERLLWLEKEVV